MPDERVTAAILCDEVRTENNNKLFLIGVYSGSVQVPAFPSNLLLSLYLEISGMRLGDHELKLRVTSPGGEVGLEIQMTVEEEGLVAIPSPKLPIVFPEAGLLKAELKVDGGAWQTALEKPVQGPPQQGS